MTNYEFYPTPHWAVHRILGAMLPLPVYALLTPPVYGRWLEPCVGAGNIIGAVREYYAGSRGPDWTTVDIRPEANADYTTDFLTWQPPRRHQLCLMNPPFSKAIEFADKAFSCCDYVIMLQRLDWLASERRCEWMRAHTPNVFVLPNRPSFAGGGTDGRDYAWFVWSIDDEYSGHSARMVVLPNTPVEQRDKGDAPVNDRQQKMPNAGG